MKILDEHLKSSHRIHADRNYCVYILLDESDHVLYVGQSRAVHKRIGQHTHSNPHVKSMLILETKYDNINDALIKEQELIITYEPPENLFCNKTNTIKHIRGWKNFKPSSEKQESEQRIKQLEWEHERAIKSAEKLEYSTRRPAPSWIEKIGKINLPVTR